MQLPKSEVVTLSPTTSKKEQGSIKNELFFLRTKREFEMIFPEEDRAWKTQSSSEEKDFLVNDSNSKAIAIVTR